jgi:restriction endonuclease S subunit
MKTIQLKEACDFFGDGDWIESKDQSDSGIRLIQTGNVGTGKFKDRVEKARWISEETFRNLRCTEIIEGDVLVSRLPDPVGRACLIPSLIHKAITAVDCAIIRFNRSILIPKFFIYYSQSNDYYSTIQPLISGSTRQRISREKLGNLLIPQPTILEQKSIVEKLDKAFAEIDSLEKGIEQLQFNVEKIESTLLLNLWNKYRKELTSKKLSDVADYENGKAHENIIDENGFFKVVNSKFISTGGLKFKRTSIALSPLCKGEIAMVLSDVPNGKALAKCFLIDKDNVYSLNQRICKISSRVLIPEYLFINLNRNPYLLGFNNGENQTNLRLKDVLNTPIYFTDILTQGLIIKEYKEQFTYINLYKANLSKKLNLLRELKQSFLGNEFSASGLAT